METVKIVARRWERRWTQIARECEIVPLISESDLEAIGKGGPA